MSSRAIWLLVLMLGGAFQSAAQLSLEAFGEPLDGILIGVVWKTSGDDPPESLNTWNVLPTIFLSGVVSDVITLCQFGDAEKVHDQKGLTNGAPHRKDWPWLSAKPKTEKREIPPVSASRKTRIELGIKNTYRHDPSRQESSALKTGSGSSPYGIGKLHCLRR